MARKIRLAKGELGWSRETRHDQRGKELDLLQDGKFKEEKSHPLPFRL